MRTLLLDFVEVIWKCIRPYNYFLWPADAPDCTLVFPDKSGATSPRDGRLSWPGRKITTNNWVCTIDNRRLIGDKRPKSEVAAPLHICRAVGTKCKSQKTYELIFRFADAKSSQTFHYAKGKHLFVCWLADQCSSLSSPGKHPPQRLQYYFCFCS